MARALTLRAAAVVAVVASTAPAAAAPTTLRVRSDGELVAAVARLDDSGGTIALLPHAYGELFVGPRSARPLRIVGMRGVRISHVVLDHTQGVSLARLTVSPATGNALIEIRGSHDVDLDSVRVTAQGTAYSSSLFIPDSTRVRIRRSTFTHCGDRSPSWVNCVLLYRWASHVVLEDNTFRDCRGCDFVHGRFGTDLVVRHNRFERALACRIGRLRCRHQDLIELFAGRFLRFDANRFGVYERGGAQLYLTGSMDHVVVTNNVFVGTDPRLPGYRARIGLVIGSNGAKQLPSHVTVANNTILTGAPRADGYYGSVRIPSTYGGVARSKRPLFANNVIGVLKSPWRLCGGSRASSSNVVVDGKGCSPSDTVGAAGLDAAARPTTASTLLIDRADARYAPRTDITGRRRDAKPDIGAYEYRR